MLTGPIAGPFFIVGHSTLSSIEVTLAGRAAGICLPAKQCCNFYSGQNSRKVRAVNAACLKRRVIWLTSTFYSVLSPIPDAKAVQTHRASFASVPSLTNPVYACWQIVCDNPAPKEDGRQWPMACDVGALVSRTASRSETKYLPSVLLTFDLTTR